VDRMDVLDRLLGWIRDRPDNYIDPGNQEMLIPSATPTTGGNWIPVVVHTERVAYRNERFPRRIRRDHREAIAYAERVIVGRLVFGASSRALLAAGP